MRKVYKRKIICSCESDTYYKIYKNNIWYWECFNCGKRKKIKMSLKELRLKYGLDWRIKNLMDYIEELAIETEGFNPREISEVNNFLKKFIKKGIRK